MFSDGLDVLVVGYRELFKGLFASGVVGVGFGDPLPLVFLFAAPLMVAPCAYEALSISLFAFLFCLT